MKPNFLVAVSVRQQYYSV